MVEMADKSDGECQICFLSTTVATCWNYRDRICILG